MTPNADYRNEFNFDAFYGQAKGKYNCSTSKVFVNEFFFHTNCFYSIVYFSILSSNLKILCKFIDHF